MIIIQSGSGCCCGHHGTCLFGKPSLLSSATAGTAAAAVLQSS
jgi:hypothetical protein